MRIRKEIQLGHLVSVGISTRWSYYCLTAPTERADTSEFGDIGFLPL